MQRTLAEQSGEAGLWHLGSSLSALHGRDGQISHDWREVTVRIEFSVSAVCLWHAFRQVLEAIYSL